MDWIDTSVDKAVLILHCSHYLCVIYEYYCVRKCVVRRDMHS